MADPSLGTGLDHRPEHDSGTGRAVVKDQRNPVIGTCELHVEQALALPPESQRAFGHARTIWAG